MRTLVLALSLALVLVASQAFAETGSTIFGVKGGLSMANLTGDDVENTDARYGGCFGGFVEIPINQMVSFQPELLYAMKGATESWEVSGEDHEIAFKLSYIEIPVLFKINIPMGGNYRPCLLLGPEVAFKASSDVEYTVGGSSIESEVENIKSTDLGMIIGGGVGFPMANRTAMFEIRYDFGLTTIDDSDMEADVKNTALSILFGITL